MGDRLSALKRDPEAAYSLSKQLRLVFTDKIPKIFEGITHIFTMSDFEPAPSEAALTDEREEWVNTQDTRERIRAVVTGLQTPATATTIADRAQCSTNAARKHLDALVDLGIVQQRDEPSGTRYVRNEAYFRWRRANELATTHTIETLLEKLAELETRAEQFQQRFDAATPADVHLPEDVSHDELESRLETLSEWETARVAVDRHKEALRIARREDDRLTAEPV